MIAVEFPVSPQWLADWPAFDLVAEARARARRDHGELPECVDQRPPEWSIGDPE